MVDDELAALAGELGNPRTATKMVEADHALVRFYMPAVARLSAAASAGTAGRRLITYERVAFWWDSESALFDRQGVTAFRVRLARPATAAYTPRGYIAEETCRTSHTTSVA